ncbi:hypothetical protein AB0C34_17425 [Nocardia sp. NPDC049220]|uniref:hypothetical protein n=1 Tax=Nocardia sp. NPDC049220 TaxID=3155273 RepID=UPI0034048347
MTAPAIHTTSIEHLDHQPTCGFKRHKTPVTATYWVQAHACEERLMCTAHTNRLRELGHRLLSKHGYIECAHCLAHFSTFETYAAVVSL